jgi:mannosyl-oligosaccharide alpha-1,2-mannosidase
MNRNAPVAFIPPTKDNNGFDWSTMQFKHPPGPIRPLPTFPAKALKPPQIQYSFKSGSYSEAGLRNARREKVKALFRKNWAAYRKYAWGRDALLPLSAGAKDQFSGWAATLLDSLDTLWIMGTWEEFDEAVRYVAEHIAFGASTADRVNAFETNNRYLGGLLAAYDLSGREGLLRKAVELGDLLHAAFNTPNRMPADFIDFQTAKAGKVSWWRRVLCLLRPEP